MLGRFWTAFNSSVSAEFQNLIGMLGRQYGWDCDVWIDEVSKPYRYARKGHLVLNRQKRELFQNLIGMLGSSGLKNTNLTKEKVSKPYRYARKSLLKPPPWRQFFRFKTL